MRQYSNFLTEFRFFTKSHKKCTIVSHIMSPLSLISSCVFSLFLIAYPIFLGVANFLAHNNNYALWLRIDVTWMHCLSDIVACIFGAWCSCKACSPRCLVNPAWCAGKSASRYAIPILKGAILCSLLYCVSILPTVIQSDVNITNFPYFPLLCGGVTPSAFFAIGFTLGVIIGNRWAIVFSALLSFAIIWCCIYGVIIMRNGTIPQGDIFPRYWGSSLYAILPVSDAGIGAEPGLRMNPWLVTLRIFFVCVVIVSCILCCAHIRYFWQKGSYWRIKAISLSLIMPIVCACCIAMWGPKPWIRSGPFVPQCTTFKDTAFSVCVHPEEAYIRKLRAVKHLKTVASWFPKNQRDSQGKGIVLVLGNAFTPTNTEKSWNLTNSGLIKLRNLKATVIQQQTDTFVRRSEKYGDMTGIAQEVLQRFVPAKCASSAMKEVYVKKNLDSNASVTAFLLAQLPSRISNDVYGSYGFIPGEANDKVAMSINNADDAKLKQFVKNHVKELNQCLITPQQVLSELGDKHEK